MLKYGKDKQLRFKKTREIFVKKMVFCPLIKMYCLADDCRMCQFFNDFKINCQDETIAVYCLFDVWMVKGGMSLE